MDINNIKSQLAAMQEEINRAAEQYGLGGHLQYMLNGGEVHQLPVMPYGFAEGGNKNTKGKTLDELAKERGVSVAQLKKQLSSMKPGDKFSLKLNDPRSWDAPEQGGSDLYYTMDKGDKYTLGPNGMIYEGGLPQPAAPVQPMPVAPTRKVYPDYFKSYSANPTISNNNPYPGIAPDNYTVDELVQSIGSDPKFLAGELSKLKPGDTFNTTRGDGKNSYGGIKKVDNGMYTVGPNGQVFASNDPRIKNIDFTGTPVLQGNPNYVQLQPATSPTPFVKPPVATPQTPTTPAQPQPTVSKPGASQPTPVAKPTVVARTPVLTPKQAASMSTGTPTQRSSSYLTNTTVYSPEQLRTMDLNQATSIVDAMKLMGDDSSFANRKKVAESVGIKNYTGSDAQNKELLQKYYASKRTFSDNTTQADIDALSGNAPVSIAPVAPTPGAMPTPAPTPATVQPQVAPKVQAPVINPNDPFYTDNTTAEDLALLSAPDVMPELQSIPAGQIPNTPAERPAPAQVVPPRQLQDVQRPVQQSPVVQPIERSQMVFPQAPDNRFVESGTPFATGTPSMMQSNMGVPLATNQRSVVESDFPKYLMPEPTAIAQPEPTVINTDKVVPKELDDKIKKSDSGKPTVVNPSQLNPIVRASILEAAGRNNGRFIVTDKGTKTTYYGTVENGKIKFYKNEVLTGQNDKPTMSGTDYSYQYVHEDPTKRITPVGAFATSYNPEIYGQPGINLEGTDVAMHATAHPEQRNKFYNNNTLSDNNQSMSCINNKCYDMKKLMKFYNQNNKGRSDSVYVIDSRLTPEQNALIMNKNKHERVYSPKEGVEVKVADWMKDTFGFENGGKLDYYSGGEIENDPHILELYGFQNGGQIVQLPVMPYGFAEQGIQIPVAPYGFNQNGGANYEEGGQMPMDVAVARFKAAGKDKGLSGGELQMYVEKMKSKYNYQKGGVVSEKELGNYEVGMYGTGGIMYNGTKFPGYNKPISTAPGDKFRKQMVLQKGGKIKLVKFGHR